MIFQKGDKFPEVTAELFQRINKAAGKQGLVCAITDVTQHRGVSFFTLELITTAEAAKMATTPGEPQ